MFEEIYDDDELREEALEAAFPEHFALDAELDDVEYLVDCE
jgi:hypothetical protein